MEILFWGAIVRIMQAILHAAPTILVGILVAAVFQRVLGRGMTFRLFGGRTWRQLPQAWLMGMLLPVCSLGAIPVMSELRKAGLVGGTILAFGLTAPIFNPVSVLYGLSLSHPAVILTICLCSLGLVTTLGVLWDRMFQCEYIEIETTEPMPYGVRRIAAVGLSVLRISYSRDMLWMTIGTLGVGLLSCILPPNSLQTSAERDDWFAPIRMAAIALPAYVTPMDAMVQLSTMFQHGNSIAAAFTLLILGTGLNLGMISWIAYTFAWKKTVAWIVMAVTLVVGLGYLIDSPLSPRGITPVGHTHAFDQFCGPIADSTADAFQDGKRQIVEGTQVYEGFSLGILVFLVAGGLIASWFDPCCTFEKKLSTEVTEASQRTELIEGGISATGSKPSYLKHDIVLPNSVVATFALGGLVLASIVGCFIYYPPPEVLFKELAATNAETCTRVSSREWGSALHWIPVYEDQLRKLQVGMYLRMQRMTEQQSALLEQLEEDLEMLEHASLDEDAVEAATAERAVRIGYIKFRNSMNSTKKIE